MRKICSFRCSVVEVVTVTGQALLDKTVPCPLAGLSKIALVTT